MPRFLWLVEEAIYLCPLYLHALANKGMLQNFLDVFHSLVDADFSEIYWLRCNLESLFDDRNA
jgi:hypothetical protein